MRLWPWQMLPILPNKQVLGQHRECCALRGNGWGKKHSTVDYVFNYSPMRLSGYHQLVLAEFKKRGYQYDQRWEYPQYRGQFCEEYSGEFWVAHSLEFGKTYPEHDEAYYNECVKNLADKGNEVFKSIPLPVVMFNYTAHRELWDWLANNPSKGKLEWPGWRENGGKHHSSNGCFACEYCSRITNKQRRNKYCECPLVWPLATANSLDCFTEGSPYAQWHRGYNWETLSKERMAFFARQVRDLPIFPGVLFY